MPLIKGKDVPAIREPGCGQMIKWYPLGPTDDICSWLTVRVSSAEEEKWPFQAHKHKDFCEYWFVIEGKGKIYVGDEVYEVEKGDLVSTPPDTPHKASGDMTFISMTALHNVYAQCIGRKIPHEATEEVYRENPEDVTKPGQYVEYSGPGGQYTTK